MVEFLQDQSSRIILGWKNENHEDYIIRNILEACLCYQQYHQMGQVSPLLILQLLTLQLFSHLSKV